MILKHFYRPNILLETFGFRRILDFREYFVYCCYLGLDFSISDLSDFYLICSDRVDIQNRSRLLTVTTH